MWEIPLSRFKEDGIDFRRWRPLYSFNDAHETNARDQVRFCDLISFQVIFCDFYMLLEDMDVMFQSSKVHKLKLKATFKISIHPAHWNFTCLLPLRCLKSISGILIEHFVISRYFFPPIVVTKMMSLLNPWHGHQWRGWLRL